MGDSVSLCYLEDHPGNDTWRKSQKSPIRGVIPKKLWLYPYNYMVITTTEQQPWFIVSGVITKFGSPFLVGEPTVAIVS